MKRKGDEIINHPCAKECRREGKLDGEVVFVIEDFLNLKEIDLLNEDIDMFRKVFREQFNQSDLGDYGSAIDPFEFQNILPSSSIRIQQDSYLNSRWKTVEESSCKEINSGIKEVFSSVVFTKIPQIISAYLFHCNYQQNLFLFNEQYIVKDTESSIAFRWHRDADEQFSATLDHEKPLYISIWCNLDPVSKVNGTIAFQKSANIIRVQGGNETEEHKNLNFFSTSSSPPPNEDEEGIELDLPKGSLVIFGSQVWHRSGINQSNSARRVFYTQYSTEPITLKEKHKPQSIETPISFAIPITIKNLFAI
eukprot:gene2883-3067_t